MFHGLEREPDPFAMHAGDKALEDQRFTIPGRNASLEICPVSRHITLLGGGYYLNVATIDNRSALLVYDVQERRCPFRVRNPSDEFGVMRMDHAWLVGEASSKRGAE